MNEMQRDENEPPEHYELRYLLQEVKAIVLPMNPDQRLKWVAESRTAQQIYGVIVQHPQYYEEFRGFVGGVFPEPKVKGRRASGIPLMCAIERFVTMETRRR